MNNLPLAYNVMFVGMVVVFLVLILLIAAISLLPRIFNKNKSEIKVKDDPDYIISTERSVNNEYSASDTELIAVLTAAIQACYRSDIQTRIRVKSFRRIPETSPIWNTTGRSEYISEKL